MATESLENLLSELFAGQRLAVLATQEPDRPHLSLMGFAPTPDLSHLVVATDRRTRKYRNLTAHPQVALLVDNRANEPADFANAVAVTVQGAAAEVDPGERNFWLSLYVGRHPDLKDFAVALDTALIKIKVERFVVVSRFQEVPFWASWSIASAFFSISSLWAWVAPGG